jgi:hypothetical protein
MTSPTRSPIKDRPLRQAGQSLIEERERTLEDQVLPWLLAAMLFLVVAAVEWFQELTGAANSPRVFTLVAAVAVAACAWRIARIRPRLRRLRQGIDGEKAVGQYLERLRQDGYDVFHDVTAEGFNVDHVLVGPAGIFTVETKTWSKPERGDAKVAYDGTRLTANGLEPDRDPVVQAKAQSRWLGTIVRESTGRDFDVFPVVLFPGWFVEQDRKSRSTVWLLEPKGLPAFLQQEPVKLTREEVKLAAFHLSRFIRGRERDKTG